MTRLALAKTKKIGTLEIGVADNKLKQFKNQSGASHKGNLEESVCAVRSLMLESDFDIELTHSKLTIQLVGEERKAHGGQWFQGTGQEW